MSCQESARKTALECAGKLEYEARGMAVLRSVDATEAAKWLREIAAAIREACGPDEPADPAEPWLAGGVSKAEKPSCIPADCQHFEQLPSGLWAWVEAPLWYIEDKGNPVPWIFNSDDLGADYKHMYERSIFQATVSEPDFLAARALGVSALGWAK